MQMSISEAWNSLVHGLEQENGRGHSLVPSSLPRCIGYQDVYVDERTWLPRAVLVVDDETWILGANRRTDGEEKKKREEKWKRAGPVSHKYRKGRETKCRRTRVED